MGNPNLCVRRAGLAEEWDKVKEAYAAANRALGNIVKVTPSSKVVGDLANFMVSNGLDDTSLVERAGDLTFPTSVIEFMQERPPPPPPPLCSADQPYMSVHGTMTQLPLPPSVWHACFTSTPTTVPPGPARAGAADSQAERAVLARCCIVAASVWMRVSRQGLVTTIVCLLPHGAPLQPPAPSPSPPCTTDASDADAETARQRECGLQLRGRPQWAYGDG